MFKSLLKVNCNMYSLSRVFCTVFFLLAFNPCSINAQDRELDQADMDLIGMDGQPNPEIDKLEFEAAAAKVETKLPIRVDPNESIESTLFDLYLSDQFQGNILARYTDDWFEIDDIYDLLDQLKDVKEKDKFAPLLDGRIEKQRGIVGLGNVRYDLRNFRIVLDLDPEFLPSKKVNLLNRLPDPENNFALMQNFGVASSGQFGEERNTALTYRTLVSKGKYYGTVDVTSVREGEDVVTEATASGIVDKYAVGAGLMQTRGQAFASTVDILGVRMQTSEDIFLNQNGIRGSSLQIFVPSRARVEFYREQRLLSVQDLDFGLQEINTTSFPDGSYDVDVVIIEDNGNVSRDKRFFTKSGFLAIRSKPIIYLQGGVLRDQLEIYSKPIYQAGLRWRATGIMELKASTYGSDEININDLEALAVYRDFILGGGISASDKGDKGIIGSFMGKVLGFNINASASDTLSGGLDQDSIRFEQDNRPGILSPSLSAEDRAKLVAPERSTFSASINRNIGNLQLSFLANRNKRPRAERELIEDSLGRQADDTDRYAYGPRAIYQIIQNRQNNLRIETSYLNTEDGNRAGVSLIYRYNFSETLNTFSEYLQRRQNGGEQLTLRNTINYDARERATLKGTRVLFSNEARRDQEPESQKFVTNQVQIDHTNDYLESSGFFRDVSLSNNDARSYGINANSSFIYDSNGVQVSYPPKQAAIFIADVRSKSSKERFDLVVNGQVFAVVEAGKKSVIGLQPYRSYKITIRPKEESEFVNYNSKVYEITLFPGNIVRKSWDVEKVFIAVGRLVDKDNKPIANHRIKGTRDYAVTESDGSFQFEMVGNEELYMDNPKYKCKIHFDPLLLEDYKTVIDVGDNFCQ